MTLYIQHGHGKSDKIYQAIDNESANGVIIAARNERVVRLDNFLEELNTHYNQLDLIFDPQFFVSTITPPADRFLEDYPYYSPGRGAADFVGARRISRYARQTIDFQTERSFTRATSPTVIIRSFADRWAQIALNLADSSIDYHAGLTNPQPLLVSIIVSESALDDRDELDAFLDILTSWDVQGFYIVLAREDSTYTQIIDPDRLAHLLYLIYVLGDRNDYEVVCGYSDFIGLPLMAAGADAIGNGWFQSLRQFHMKSFLRRRAGGSRPLLRYSSGPLLNSIRLSELESIYEAGYLESVLSDVELDSRITDALSPDAADWSQAISELQHWQTLSQLIGELTGRVRIDVARLARQIRQSQGLLNLLTSEGVPFERESNLEQHYRDWTRGIERFTSIAGI